MTLLSRRLLLAALALASLSSNVVAQAWPSRPITLVVTQGAGSGSDVTARLLAGYLGPLLGQPVVVENRVGASGQIGHQSVIRAAPDGYTLLLTSTAPLFVVPAMNPNARYGLADFTVVAPVLRAPFAVLVANTGTMVINPALYTRLPYQTLRDFVPVARTAQQPLALVVNPSVPAQNLREFIAYAKANPGKLNYASAGNGGISHLVPEMFKQAAGIYMVHLPYRGSAPAFSDLLAGHAQFMAESIPQVSQYVKQGKVRALGVTSRQRNPALPGTSGSDASRTRSVTASARNLPERSIGIAAVSESVANSTWPPIRSVSAWPLPL